MKYTLDPEDIKRCRTISRANADLVKSIARAVSDKTGVSVTAIYGTSVSRPVVAARHLVMFLAHKAELSYPLIGQAMGRDHTTVLAAVRKEKQRREDEKNKAPE